MFSICSSLLYGHGRCPTSRPKEDKKGSKRCCFCCLGAKEARHICAGTTVTAIRNNGVLKRTRGTGLALGVMDAGKGSWVSERREGIRNFSKSEGSTQRNLDAALCFLSFHSSSLSHIYILPPSPFCLPLRAPQLFDLVDFARLFLLTSASMAAVRCSCSCSAPAAVSLHD